jgi:hypothetical protein
MKTEPIEDDWTEAHSATIGRVDLVAKAANGSPSFLLMKGNTIGGLLDPEVVRELIAKANPEPPTVSSADLMAAIHAASAPTQETPMLETEVLKADESEAADAVLGDDAPLPDADEVASGATDGADGAGVPTDAPGDPDDPASPAWEAVDAARARQALQLTVALQRLVTQSTQREAQELAVPGNDGDMSDVWTLEDVSCAIDAVISMLAPFAITEQAEADQGAADSLTKAAALIKAGRVLSSANEAKIRGAADALQAVLGSLPAPVEDAAPVAKSEETKVTDETEATELEKAKGDPQMAVFDANGKLCGTINPTDLSPIAAPEADGAKAPEAPAPVVQPDATDGPVEGAPVAPVPPVAEPVAKEAKDDEIDLLKSSLADAVEALRKQGERLGLLEAQPMPGGPMMNGALPGAEPIALRGQNDGETSELTKAWQDETNPVRKQELQMELAAHMVRNAPRLP